MLALSGTRTSNISVWCYDDNGSLDWTYDTGGHTYGIARDSSGNIYVVGVAADNGDGNGTRNLWKLDSSGNYVAGVNFGSIAGYDGKYIDIDTNYIYVANPTGAFRLTHALGSQTTIASGSCLAVKADSSGNIYVGAVSGVALLRKYNSSLVLQWTKDTADNCYSIDLNTAEDVIIGTSDSEVRKYLADGSSAAGGTWAYAISGGGTFVRAAVASDDTIYACVYNLAIGAKERVTVIDDDGNRLWGITTAAGDLENIFVDASDGVWVCGDLISGYSLWYVDTTSQTLMNIGGASNISNGIAGTGISIQYWRRILTEHMPAVEPHFADVKLEDRTASRLLATDALKVTTSSDLVSWVAGTANEINVADDGDGSITIGIVDPLVVGKGGTGAATLTDHSLLVGSGTDAITALGAATNGQLPIGSTGVDPVLATLTGTAKRVSVTNAAGSITLSGPQDLDTVDSPTFAGLTISDGGTLAVGCTDPLEAIIRINNSSTACKFFMDVEGLAGAGHQSWGWSTDRTVNGDFALIRGTVGAAPNTHVLYFSPTGNATISGTLAVTGGNSTNWNTAYTHSQLVVGNPHVVTPTELGLVIGTDVQAHDASLDSIAGLTYASGSFIKLSAEDTYVVRTFAEVKTDLSLNLVENTALSTWAGTTNITTVGNLVIANGGTIGQAAGPLLTFNDTSNYLGITGCNVGIGTVTPLVKLNIVNSDANSQVAEVRTQNDSTSLMQFGTFGSTAPTYGTITANDAFISCYGTTDLVILADNAAGVIRLATGASGGVERVRIDSTGILSSMSHYPLTDNTYYLGKNDDDTPFAWKGIILKDQEGTGKYYRLEVNGDALQIVDLTD